jgi:arylsulfatase A-like enzyme
MKVVLIVPHGLNASYLGCYGNEWVTTPTFDRLAAEGIVFDQHYADHPDADCLCGYFLSGYYHFSCPDSSETVAAERLLEAPNLFRESGVATAMIATSDLEISPAAQSSWGRIELVPSAGGSEAILRQVVERANQTVYDLSAESQWLARVDLGTLLSLPDPPKSFRDTLDLDRCDANTQDPEYEEATNESLQPEHAELSARQQLYASMVTRLDSAIGLILSELRKLGLIDEVLVAVTCHRGQDLEELSSFRKSRGLFLHEEYVHVPLILRMPGKANADRRVAALTQPVDLTATLLDVFKLAAREFHGKSLLPLIDEESSTVREYACSGLRLADTNSWALRTADWCLLQSESLSPAHDCDATPPSRSLLFRKPEDRWEVNELSGLHRELAEALSETLRCFVAATRGQGPLKAPELPKIMDAGAHS